MNRRFFIDWHLLIPVFILIGFSLTILTSISPQLAVSQLIFFIIGLILFFLVSNLHYKIHSYLYIPYMFIALVFLFLPIIFGAVTRGSIRWIQIGALTLQSSEIIKPLLIIIFSAFLSQKNKSSSLKKLAIYLVIFLIPALLIFKQPDLGSTLVVAAIWIATLFVSDIPLFYLFSLFIITAISSPIIWKFLADYQKQRLIVFLNPYADPKGAGYHMLQSIIAIGSGGVFGRGLGSGIQSQLRFLPENHTDFIFASLTEELGLITAFFILAVFFFLLKRLLDISRTAPDKFSQLLTIGVFAMIFFQTVVNIGMNLGILPITGITLPLVSYGGSSILATMISLGLVSNFSSQPTHKKILEIK